MLLLKWDEELKEWTSKIIRLLTTAIVKKAQPGGIIILKEVHPIVTASSPNRNSGSEGTQGGTIGGVQTRISQVDFPQFNGEDLIGWIYKAEKIFEYQKTADEEKIALASFHLQDDALQ